MEADIGPELAILDKVNEFYTSSFLAELTPSKSSKKRKHEETSPDSTPYPNGEETFRAEIDRAFAEFNDTLLKIYDTYDKTPCAKMNATKRLICMRQELRKKPGNNELL